MPYFFPAKTNKTVCRISSYCFWFDGCWVLSRWSSGPETHLHVSANKSERPADTGTKTRILQFRSVRMNMPVASSSSSFFLTPLQTHRMPPPPPSISTSLLSADMRCATLSLKCDGQRDDCVPAGVGGSLFGGFCWRTTQAKWLLSTAWLMIMRHVVYFPTDP